MRRSPGSPPGLRPGSRPAACWSAAARSELIDGQPVVAGGVVEVDHPSLRAPYPPAVSVLDGHAVDGHAVERPVAGFHGRPLRPVQPPRRIVERLGRQFRVEPRQRLPQRRGQHHRAVVGPLRRRRLRVDLRPVDDAPPQLSQPAEGGASTSASFSPVTAPPPIDRAATHALLDRRLRSAHRRAC